MKPPAIDPPTREQEDFLETFLSNPSLPERTFSLGELRGFLFAVAAAPDLVRPSEWIPVVFDDDEPVYESLEEAQQIMATLTALYNDAIQLVQSSGERRPRGCEFMDNVLDNFEPDAPVSEWARGFTAGHLWLEESWKDYLIEEMEEEMGAVLTTLSFFGSRHIAEEIVEESENPDATLESYSAMFRRVFFDAVTGYAQMSMMIREAVAEVDPHPSSAAGAQRPVGRNQPCPCGSGKKYKRCCALKEQ